MAQGFGLPHSDYKPYLGFIGVAIIRFVPARHKIIPAGEHIKLGAFLRSTREAAGVSQRELARRLNLAQSYVSKIERGERQIQALELFEICRKIGLQPDEFVRSFLS